MMSCYRDWFVPQLTPLQRLQDELIMERALREAAEQRIQEEVLRRIRAERDRDHYRVCSCVPRSVRGWLVPYHFIPCHIIS